MLSYWEKKNFREVDFLVIGAGIVGLSTALQYKAKFPKNSVLVLERGLFPSGASTKNAGFACFGSLSEIADDLIHMTESEVLNLVWRRFEGLKEIKAIFGKEALDFQIHGGFELLRDEEIKYLKEIPRINELLLPIFKEPVFGLEKRKERFGFGPSVLSMVANRFEGQLDPGRFIQVLWEKCQAAQVKILTGAEVVELSKEPIEVKVNANSSQGQVSFCAEAMAICTNAFANSLIPELNLNPGRGMIMLSKPIDNFPWQGTFHLDRGYVYFRNIDGRLLLGGGRNVDFSGESTTAFGISSKIKEYLIQLADTVIFPGKSVAFEMDWSGIMAFGESKIPIVKMIKPNVGVAVRLGGMGVAVGWQVAKELVKEFDSL
ncbi:NAD(P)/FAD-dependent oxidoreductase [Pararhodonellum marinum]|uniref:NAD(P)/FAD-dependent oxidoreductase n=1 Tax=Pararhodonellum marinum TaxID=2755358 RepID=UPI00189052F2|nr:FAD-dependent oxidoreductase [Pararhodonellum marinum]